jgi:mannitol-1-phosphate/altronate dehydrogenase
MSASSILEPFATPYLTDRFWPIAARAAQKISLYNLKKSTGS